MGDKEKLGGKLDEDDTTTITEAVEEVNPSLNLYVIFFKKKYMLANLDFITLS